MVPIKGIKEAWPSSQIEDIEDESGAIFKARGETAKDKAGKVNKADLIIIIYCLTPDSDPYWAHADYSLCTYREKTLFKKTP